MSKYEFKGINLIAEAFEKHDAKFRVINNHGQELQKEELNGIYVSRFPIKYISSFLKMAWQFPLYFSIKPNGYQKLANFGLKSQIPFRGMILAKKGVIYIIMIHCI